MFKYFLFKILKKCQIGCLTIKHLDREYQFGDKADNKHTAFIEVHSSTFFKQICLYGGIGFGEGYVDKIWDTPDLKKVLNWFLINQAYIPSFPSNQLKSLGLNMLGVIDLFVESRKNKNDSKQAKKNIVYHYDISNDFFELMLDPTMAYSSALFKNSKESLEDAQINKFEALCQELRLKANDHLLEIGSGWGGFAIYAAQTYQCQITTVTISNEQFAYVKEKVKKLKLEHLIDIQLKDYREIEDTFDKIVSIEMIEAIGYYQLDTFTKKCTSLLRAGGLLAIQMITYNDHYFFKYIKSTNWITKHIFPGSQLISIVEFLKGFRRHGQLTVNHIDSLAESYAKTLSIWRENVYANLDKIKAMNFDENFIRKWDFYLLSCEVAFIRRYLDSIQITLVNKHQLTQPQNSINVFDQWKEKKTTRQTNNTRSKSSAKS